MSESKELYILKPGFKARKHAVGKNEMVIFAKDEALIIDKKIFNELFERLDVDKLKQQIAELILPFIKMSEAEGYYGLDNSELFHKLDESDNDTDLIVDMILGLVGLSENKE